MWEQGEEDDQEDWNIDYFGKIAKTKESARAKEKERKAKEEETETQATEDSKENAMGVKKWDTGQATGSKKIAHLRSKGKNNIHQVQYDDRSDMANLKKKQTWERSMCALEDVEERKSTIGKLTMVPASVLTPAVMLRTVRRDHDEPEGVGQATQRKHTSKTDRQVQINVMDAHKKSQRL